MIKKTLKYGGIAIVCLIIVTLASALLYRKYLQNEVSEARAICARFIVRRFFANAEREKRTSRTTCTTAKYFSQQHDTVSRLLVQA